MRTIFKWPLPLQDQVVIYPFPRGAKIVHVAEQKGSSGKSIYLWAEFDMGGENIRQVFYLVGTGQSVPTTTAVHVGTTVILDDQVVVHVYMEAQV